MSNDAKYKIYIEEAEKMYVQLLMSLQQIAEKLPVHLRTLQNWRHKGNWDLKRQENMNRFNTIHNYLYESTICIFEKLMKHFKDPEGSPNISEMEERILRSNLSKLPGFTKIEQLKEMAKPEEEEGEKLSFDEKLNKILERFI
jgi:hypothetical protein